MIEQSFVFFSDAAQSFTFCCLLGPKLRQEKLETRGERERQRNISNERAVILAPVWLDTSRLEVYVE